MNTLYIAGAGVSAASGIPTFRGEDGYWTIGSKNYTPMQMATRAMYMNNPAEFLSWYYHRFVVYRHYGPNEVHYWLSDKNVITQNIDGLDGKAGNPDYIAIHGRIDQMTFFHDQGGEVDDLQKLQAPWDKVDEENLRKSLLDLFQIDNSCPVLDYSYKPFVLLFDEYYTELYRMWEAKQRMKKADEIVFMGTSFSVRIPHVALDIARYNGIPVEVVNPNPVLIDHPDVTYKRMTALEYIQNHG